MEKHLIYKASNMLNLIPSNIKDNPFKPFSRKLQIYIQSNCVWDGGGTEDVVGDT